MPGTQPRGTHAFEPSGSSAQSSQMLSSVNAEEEEPEDTAISLADVASTFPDVTSPSFPDVAGTSFPHVTPASSLDILGYPAGPSSMSHPPDISSSGGTRPPSSSSLPYSTQQRNTSTGSAFSHSLSITDSEPDNAQRRTRKRKHDGRSASGAHPLSSTRSVKSKTSDLNPVILSNALNSTLNRLADVMEKSLDANKVEATKPPTTNATTSSVVNPPVESQATHPLPLASASSQDILNQAVEAFAANKTLSEDELLAASLFFYTWNRSFGLCCTHLFSA